MLQQKSGGSQESEKFTEDQKHMYFCCRNNLTVCFKVHTKVSNIVSPDKFILIHYNDDQSFTTGLWVLQTFCLNI